MNVAAALVAQTVPFAGAVMVGNQGKWHDLFAVAYIAAVGLLLSLLAALEDLNGLTHHTGLSVDALQ